MGSMMVIDQAHSDDWHLWQADCVDVLAGLPDNSIHYSIFSPPFQSLYVFSDDPRDVSNNTDDATFWEHFSFVIAGIYRVIKPGRLVSVHCMQLPTSKLRDGFIGLRDFRGEIIRGFQGDEAAELYAAIKIMNRRAADAFAAGDAARGSRLSDIADKMTDDLESHPGRSGFIYHSEVCIRKDPVSAMQRTKSIGLLHKQVTKDSTVSRMAVADYIVTLRKPGDNAEPVSGRLETYYGDDVTDDEFAHQAAAEFHQAGSRSIEDHKSISIWQRYAEPIWLDIAQSDTLSRVAARAEEDERHISPLQLTVIRRCLDLWTNPGDVVFSPFAGIGSAGYVALEMRRRFVGAELKRSYWEQAVANLRTMERQRDAGTLFGAAAE